MAKKKAKKKKQAAKRAPARAPRVSASVASAEAEIPVIEVPAGGTLDVIADVSSMTVPYSVAYDGNTVIKSLVDCARPVPLKRGSFLLGWQFPHTGTGWEHTLSYSINGGPPKVLEKMSDAKKDPANSIGIALVRS
jgi:hypothetical protein